MDLQEYVLGDGDGRDHADRWYELRDDKGDSETPGEAVRISGQPCLRAYCMRLSILGPDTNDLPESVGIDDYHLNRLNVGQAHDGERQIYQWSFRLGQGFPTAREDDTFVVVTEWHSTPADYNPPGHPLVIWAEEGRIGVRSDGWDPGTRQNADSGWSCVLADVQKTNVWYTMRVEASWNDVAGHLTIRLDDPSTGPGWDASCVRDDGRGNLFRDLDGAVDTAFMTHNLYISSDYTRPFTVWYDNTVQDPNLPDPYG